MVVGGPVMQGEVQCRSRFLKRWQGRHMVLTADALAIYQSSSLQRKCCKLPRARIVRVGAVDPLVLGQHCLELVTKWRRFVVATDSATERDSWLQVFGAPVQNDNELRVTSFSAQKDDSDELGMLEAEALRDLQEILSLPDEDVDSLSIRHANFTTTGNNPSRRRAAKALLQMRPLVLRQCLELLCELAASDSDAEVRKLAVIGLGKLPKEDAEEDWGVFPTLLNSMLDTHPDTCFHAAESLRHFGIHVHPKNIRALQESLLNNDGD